LSIPETNRFCIHVYLSRLSSPSLRYDFDTPLFTGSSLRWRCEKTATNYHATWDVYGSCRIWQLCGSRIAVVWCTLV